MFPTPVRIGLAVAIAAIDYTQTQHILALSPEVTFGIGLASAVSGVLLAFQNGVASAVRSVRGR
jgi:hypothetical protein